MDGFKAGDKAPDFELPATLPGGGETRVKLSGLSGGWVVIFLYPKDATSG